MARGGYSTIWGAAMLPGAPCDLQAWPFPARDLAPFYELVLRGLPFSATNDALTREFPLYRDDFQALAPSPIVQSFLGALDRSRFLRGRDDVAYGQARVAVRASGIGDIAGVTRLLNDIESGAPLLAVRELSITQPEPAAPDGRAEALRFEMLVEGLARVEAARKTK